MTFHMFTVLCSEGSSVNGACDVSEKAALEQFSSGLTELELGTDEVFVIASAPNSAQLPFSPHTVSTLLHPEMDEKLSYVSI